MSGGNPKVFHGEAEEGLNPAPLQSVASFDLKPWRCHWAASPRENPSFLHEQADQKSNFSFLHLAFSSEEKPQDFHSSSRLRAVTFSCRSFTASSMRKPFDMYGCASSGVKPASLHRAAASPENFPNPLFFIHRFASLTVKVCSYHVFASSGENPAFFHSIALLGENPSSIHS